MFPHKQYELLLIYFWTSLTFQGGWDTSCYNEHLWLRPVQETVSFRNVTVQTHRIEERKKKVVSWEFTDTRMLTDRQIYHGFNYFLLTKIKSMAIDSHVE